MREPRIYKGKRIHSVPWSPGIASDRARRADSVIGEGIECAVGARSARHASKGAVRDEAGLCEERDKKKTTKIRHDGHARSTLT